MRIAVTALAAVGALSIPAYSLAQSYPTARGGRVIGTVQMCVDVNGLAAPCSSGGSGPASNVAVTSLPPLTTGSAAIGSVSVSNLPATQAVSATSLPLPAGAATSGLQPIINADGGAQAHVTNFPSTQPVTASALPLPSGASTSALQPALNGDGGSLSHITNFPGTQAVTLASLPSLAAGAAAIGSVTVSSLPAIAGTVSSNSRPVLLSPQTTADVALSGSAAQVLAAVSGYVRVGWKIASSSGDTTSAGDTKCTEDGSTATASHFSIVVYGRSVYPNDPGVPVSQAAINCIGPASVSVTEWRSQQ